jgi:hypothetical protein
VSGCENATRIEVICKPPILTFYALVANVLLHAIFDGLPESLKPTRNSILEKCRIESVGVQGLQKVEEAAAVLVVFPPCLKMTKRQSHPVRNWGSEPVQTGEFFTQQNAGR